MTPVGTAALGEKEGRVGHVRRMYHPARSVLADGSLDPLAQKPRYRLTATTKLGAAIPRKCYM